MRSRFKLIVIVLLLLVLSGYFVLNKVSEKVGFNGAYDIVSTIGGNYLNSEQVEEKSMQLIFSEKAFAKIKTRRLASLKRGMIVNDEDAYVPVKIIHNQDTLTGQARLKGHMTDHLEGVKWSYRIKLDDDQKFLGMKRFTMQHPGTRNYLYEWVFHELLKQEDIIALQYDFMNVRLNGDELGVYAIEEHFAEELLERNSRPRGAVMRFNPNLYWVGRENLDLFHLNFYNEFSKYHTAFLEPYDRGRVRKDTVLLNNFLQGQFMIEKFRNGELATSEVFDVEKMASYHAINDLVGGYHSLDWSDVKYYYNPESKKIEPVGYESFSVRPISQLAGSYKYLNEPIKSNEFHAILFSDKVFFGAYLKAVSRMSHRKFLDDFISSINDSLGKKMAIVYSEFPYENFNTQGYVRNQRVMEKSLEIPKAFHGYVNNLSTDTLSFKLGCLNAFPTQLKGLKIDNELQQIDFIMPSKSRLENIEYYEYQIRLDENLISELKSNKSTVKIIWSLPGLDKDIQTELFQQNNLYLDSDENDTVIFLESRFHIPPGKNEIDKHTEMVLSNGYTGGKSRIIIKNNTVLKITDSHKFIGSEENPLIIEGENNSTLIFNENQSYIADYCVFKNLKIEYTSSTVSNRKSLFENCQLRGTNGKISVRDCVYSSSTISANNCDMNFSDVQFLQFEESVSNAKGKMKFSNCKFIGSVGTSISANLGSVELNNVKFNSIKKEALNLVNTFNKIENCQYSVENNNLVN